MMFHCVKAPKRMVKEEFIQEQLYVEDQEFLTEVLPKKKIEEEVERGVFVIDLF